MARDTFSGARSTPANARNILFVATIDGHIRAFHLPYLKWFKERGWTTHVAAWSGDAFGDSPDLSERAPADGRDLGADVIPYCDHKYDISIRRSPADTDNIRAYGQLKRILAQTHFDIVHCHTPMGGILGRLAARGYRKTGTKLLYTSHGFHFYKGGPRSGWLLYYPVEKHFSRYTDALLTINTEDYELARSKLHARETFFTRGMGYDDRRFFVRAPGEKQALRSECGHDPSDILLVYVAELNENKNQGLLIRALARIPDERVKLLLIGPDSTGGAYARLASELGLAGRVVFTGRRDDIERLIPMCDIAVCSSIREGLGMNVIEAMACGLPVVATDNRGHRELIKDGGNGFLVAANDDAAVADRVERLITDRALYETFSARNIEAAQPYAYPNATRLIISIYEKICAELDSAIP